MANLTYLLKLVGRHRRLIFLSLVTSGAISLLGVFLPYFSKAQIDQLQLKHTQLGPWNASSFSLFALWLTVPFVIEFIRFTVLKRIDQKINLKLTFSSMRHIRELVWEKFKQMDSSFFENNASRRIISMVIRSDNLIRDTLYVISRVINSLVLIVVAVPILGSIGWQLIVITLITVLISTLISILDQKREVVYQTVRDRSFDEYNQVDNLLTYRYKDARVLGALGSLEEKFDKVLTKQYRIEAGGEKQRHQYQAVDSSLRDILTLATNLIAGYWVINSGFTIGTFTLVVSYTLQLSGSFRDLTNLIRTGMEMDLRLTQLKFFLSLKPRLIFSKAPKKVQVPPQSVSLKEAHFAYAGYGAEEKAYLEMILDRSRRYLARFGSGGLGWQLKGLIEDMGKLEKPTEVLKGVNFRLNRGEVVALLGRNGVGKTTITNLLMHNYELDGGKVLFGNAPVNQFDHQSLLQQFAVIQQYPVIIWGFTIRDNLTIGVNREVSDSDIWKQLEAVGLSEKIKELPKGLDTLIGDEVNLSAGQNQLLVITRVFLQKRPFIIFDEGMSNLDAEREMHIVKLLKSQSEHSGVLFITHRVTAARHADRIVVIDQGQVVQEGTHAKLVKQEGIYKHFWHLQVVS